MLDLPNGGNSSTTPQASPSAAAYARKRLMAAQANGLLPQNFNIAHTNKNLIGQFQMLSPGLAHAGHNGGATPDNQSALMALIGQLGGNNLVSRGQQGQFGGGGQLPNGGNSSPSAPASPGQGYMPPGIGDVTNGQDPQAALLQMLFGQLFGGAGGTGQAQPYYNPQNPMMY
jgi:hypothetical protein